jgi:sulfofructose kinase
VIVGLGANSVDFVCTAPAAPSTVGPASKMRLTSHRLSCGGQVATTLSAIVGFGVPARYIGAFGSDANAGLIRGELGRRGVDLTYAVDRDAPNRFAVIVIDATTGERIVLWDRDERLALSDDEIPINAIRGARLLHVDDEDIASSLRAARTARSLGIDVTTDIDRAVDGVDELVSLATHPIFSEHVAAELTGETDPERALRKIRKTHAGLLTMTLGAHGAIALDADVIVHASGFAVTPVDTTGAGDIFRAGFIYGLIHDWPVSRMLRCANAAAALSCTRSGAIDSAPGLPEVLALVG